MAKMNNGIVHLYSAKGQIPKSLKDSIDGRLIVDIRTTGKQWPVTDYYVQTAGLSAKAERAASRMGAAIIVIPEGLPFLLDMISQDCFAGDDIWIYIPSKAGDSI